MEIRDLEKKILKNSVALGLAFVLSACSTAPLRSPYGKNMKDSDRIIAMDTYQKNMMRNYGEVVDGALDGKDLKIEGKEGVVRAMQNERMKDYGINTTMFIVNGIETGYAINSIFGNKSSSSSNQPTIGTGTGNNQTGTMIQSGSSGTTTIGGFGNTTTPSIGSGISGFNLQ